jgi:hypothetical protein
LAGSYLLNAHPADFYSFIPRAFTGPRGLPAGIRYYATLSRSILHDPA